MSALTGALGSVIGYLGGEVATATLFERLLWPQRFYHNLSSVDIFKMSFAMTMGGPLHAAALEVLDQFRGHGLYLGRARGNMLGTAFLKDLQVENIIRSEGAEAGVAKASRNGFWVEVLRNVRNTDDMPSIPKWDPEGKEHKHFNVPPYRAMQLVKHLVLRPVLEQKPLSPDVVVVNEESLTWQVGVGIVCSELSTLAVAAVAGAVLHNWWLVPYMCLPLILKTVAALVRVRRFGLLPMKEMERDKGMSQADLFEIDDPNNGFAIIEGPSPLVQQFFRHYGHPSRNEGGFMLGDRTREVLSIAVIYLFVLYFPAGLIAVLLMDPQIQYLWLGYQVYAILVMHVVRVFGWDGCGRTEELVVYALERRREVWLRDANGCMVSASLTVFSVPSVAAGRAQVDGIVKRHFHQRGLKDKESPKRLDSGVSHSGLT